jgi:hypothetical protein
MLTAPRTSTARSSEVPIEMGRTTHLHFTSARPSSASFLDRVRAAPPTGHMGSLCLPGSLSTLPPVSVPSWLRSIRAFRHTHGTQFSDATHGHSTQSRIPATSGSTSKDGHVYSRLSTSNSPRIRQSVGDLGHLLLVLARLRTGAYTLSHPIELFETCGPGGGAMPRSVQEERVRRLARHHGLELKTAGRGEPRAWDFGRYWLVDAARKTLVFPDEHGGSLDDLERYLTQA